MALQLKAIFSSLLATPQFHAITADILFIATAALLLIVRVWLPPTFEGVDPEGQVSARIRLRKPHD